MTPHPEEIEQIMKTFYSTLSEKDRRRYAALEARTLGHGGISYISGLLGCSRTTVHDGLVELDTLSSDSTYDPRIRREGGGRKSYEETNPGIDAAFLNVLQDNIAGDPMDEQVRWTNLTQEEIAQRLADQHEIIVSETVIRKLLDKHNFRRRQAQKKQTMKTVPNRDEQFQKIAALKASYQAASEPVVSIDTKKKEYIGNFYRPGHLYTTETIETYDHDFNSFAEGVVIPHAIYDLRHNTGYINIGTSRDTSAFACDSIRQWWEAQGQYDYPEATSLLILCDGGGSNNSRHHIFKQDLQDLSDEIGIEIRIAHYPPYCSKYNPIEHRLFPHVTRACQGVIFKSVAIVKELMARTRTNQGLRVVVNIIDKVYRTGRKAADSFIKNMPIVFDDYLPNLNKSIT